MKKAILYVSGNVQASGYRAKIESIALFLGIKGYVQNLPDGRVKIIAQGEEANLEKLIRDINISNSLINVTNIEQEYTNPSEDYEDFHKVVDKGETDERLDIAIGLFKELITVNKDGFDNLRKELGDKIERVGVKVDAVGVKVDAVGVKVDAVGEKVDAVGEKIDQSKIEITSEIHSLRDDFNTHLEKRILHIEYELAEIKDKVMVMESSSYNFTDKQKT
jgi:acylphosphatase